jgi:hypothetical protein
MRSHTISVTVSAGSISVEPESLVMTMDDDVRWTGGNAKRFSIEFEGSGPFANSRLAFGAATAALRPRVKGRFKYSVISDDDPGLTLDPIIIIDPPPTTGGG